MPKLIASPPLEAEPVTHGDATLDALDVAPLYWIAPYPSQADAASALLKAALGLSLPAPGQTFSSQNAEIRWAGRDQAILLAEDAPDLSAHAAVSDVSDVYARSTLGPAPAAAEVLARLVPLDLRPSRFAEGATARTLLGHIPAHLTATPSGIEVMVMRSFAHTAFHEIEVAMEGVAGRKALG